MLYSLLLIPTLKITACCSLSFKAAAKVQYVKARKNPAGAGLLIRMLFLLYRVQRVHRIPGPGHAAVLQLTVVTAIAEINNEPDRQPAQQPQQVRPTEPEDHGRTYQYTQCRYYRYGRRFESPLYFGVALPHYPHTGAHQDKGKQSTDGGHFADHIPRHKSSKQTANNQDYPVGFVRRTETGMHVREDFRQ